MPRIILSTDPSVVPQQVHVLLDERVSSVHLSTDHAASQLIERLAWAIADAEEAERSASAPAEPQTRPRQVRRRGAPRALGVPGALAARS